MGLDAKPTAAAPTLTQALSEATLTHEFRMRQQTDKYRFAVLLAVTALLAHVVAVVFLSRQRAEAKELGTSIMTSTGLIYVIFGTILIVVISSTDQQLTAAIGIMGAVAGYLFGRSRADQAKDHPIKPPAGSPEHGS
jgi:protein-S-isoprenylcysteine O-methyltransferase Ste14